MYQNCAVTDSGGESRVILPIPVAIFNGQTIINSYGWSEMLSRNPSTYRARFNSTSIRQQFACHALGWVADYRAHEWNLERSRPALAVHWWNNVLNHHCNWNHSNGSV